MSDLTRHFTAPLDTPLNARLNKPGPADLGGSVDLGVSVEEAVASRIGQLPRSRSVSRDEKYLCTDCTHSALVLLFYTLTLTYQLFSW